MQMDNTGLIKKLHNDTGLIVNENVPLSPFTTWKIGGPAQMLTIVRTKEEYIGLIQYCIKKSIPYTILGKGSNVLISDEGIKGLVIINEYSHINIGEKKN